MKKQARNLVILAVLIAVVIGLRLSGIGSSLTLENVQQNGDRLASFVHDRYVAAVLLYIAVYIAAVALNVPGAAVLTMAGGFLFGALPAVLYVNIGATAGAVLSFLAARYLLGDRLQQSYAAQLGRFNDEMNRNGSRYLLTLRLIPIFPFFLVNFLSGLTRVSLVAFVWTTAVGIVPGSIVFAYAGRQIGTLRSAGDVLSLRVLIAFGALALFALVPVFWRRSGKKP